MTGPPGSGKTMLTRRIPTILPETTLEDGRNPLPRRLSRLCPRSRL